MCCENKGAAQLRGYRNADLRLCFHTCRMLVFSIHVSKIGRFLFPNRENDLTKKEFLDLKKGDPKFQTGRCI